MYKLQLYKKTKYFKYSILYLEHTPFYKKLYSENDIQQLYIVNVLEET